MNFSLKDDKTLLNHIQYILEVTDLDFFSFSKSRKLKSDKANLKVLCSQMSKSNMFLTHKLKIITITTLER